jgi:alkylhydroperoxidase family enzyme
LTIRPCKTGWSSLLSSLFFPDHASGANLDDQASLDSQKAALTYTMWATFIPMGVLGAWVSRVRLRHFTESGMKKFR